MVENDIIDAFARAISATGMVPPVDLVPDGRLHRFNPDGRGKDRSGTGWYVLHADSVPAGIFGDWRNPDTKQTWCSKASSDMTPQEQARLSASVEPGGSSTLIEMRLTSSGGMKLPGTCSMKKTEMPSATKAPSSVR